MAQSARNFIKIQAKKKTRNESISQNLFEYFP